MKESIRIVRCDDRSEDPAMFREAIQDIQHPIDLAEFTNGIELLRYLTATEVAPDIIFVHTGNASPNGLTLLEFIRAFPNLRDTPVIIHADEMTKEELEAAYVLGANLCTTRPFSAEDIRSLISKIVIAGRMPLLLPEEEYDALLLN